MKEIKNQENYSVELKINDLNNLKQLAQETNVSVDLLLKEALEDILKKYNKN